MSFRLRVVKDYRSIVEALAFRRWSASIAASTECVCLLTQASNSDCLNRKDLPSLTKGTVRANTRPYNVLGVVPSNRAASRMEMRSSKNITTFLLQCQHSSEIAITTTPPIIYFVR